MEKILLIDDDEKLGELLTEYLARFDMALVVANDPQTGFDLLQQESPKAIILDVMLPDMNGFDILKKVREDSDIPVIMLTARGELTDKVVGLELGADDYLAKPFEPRELVARIQTIVRRKVSTKADVNKDDIVVGDIRVNEKQRAAFLKEQALDLSSIEYQLLTVFMQHPGEVLSRDALLDRLRGIDWDAYNRSVDVSISRLRQKLGDDPKHPRYIKTVWGSGYMLIETE